MTSPDWTIEPLNPGHDRTRFDCGHELLTDWFRLRAGQFGRKDLARTYVAVRQADSLIGGYYALANCSVAFDVLPSDQAKGLPKKLPIPALLIGKLAVDVTVQGQRLGALLIVDALDRTRQMANQIGIRAVVVDAINEQARRFNLHFGFLALLDSPHHLFLPLSTIRALLRTRSNQ